MSKLKAAVRCNALDLSALAVQEKHGKRQDALSKRRRVRDVAPMVSGGKAGLDLRRLYDAHVEGAKLNSALKKPVLHFIIRFPPELLAGPGVGRFRGDKNARQAEFFRQAHEFINATHGGDAVFAMRLDRDEEGETIVDVFAAPKYEKRTKRTPADKPGPTWLSPTKFGKELAEKHAEEIRRRHPKATGSLTKPRHVGIALQSEFADFFKKKNGFELAPKVEKKTARKDRIEKEAHDEIEKKRKALALREQELEQREASLADAVKTVELERQSLIDERTSLNKIRDRVRSVVRKFGEIFGLPLPESLGSAVSELECELEAQEADFNDPFLEEEAENGFGL